MTERLHYINKEVNKVKEESEKVGLKLNIQKTKIMASSPITSWQINGKKVEILIDFIFSGSKITVDGNCSHEIKRCLLLGRKAVTNLDSVLKSRHVTLLTKIHIVKLTNFPVVMYGHESWTIKKATKRLTSTHFMQRYAQLLQPNGLIHLKTDSPFLYTYTQAMVKENKYPLLVNTDDLYAAEPSADVDEARSLQTHYEHQWLDRGLTIKYLRWELDHAEQLVEPDIEIEKDSYRSYGRNYVSSTNN